ncbi:enoyl-CoA hydratase/isomerase family protein [Aeromicrobium wangtongii]|uniref:3-hydroxyisobutyryl-CoA hydrolase n=1 Tax=Aeromicrobium wangtongii TaxID=2969247 RepID=A0ABY5M8B4_9ACTN|nr:enoyl-CoA hydratase/isomerase family protein [Aeromicrobium wangtongii]MCD9200126.1 enoyl-CoA hydratase/isomerase family protein [Aeromicrobium wangtongii]UUP13381.1 enoyl-CoA hydratase/isomerase family protein [Aeromicrobium wangtongii]
MSDESVVVERRGRLGVLTLNRPRAINALVPQMVHLMQQALDTWAEDDAVEAVLVTGAGERGLCAGGDLQGMYRSARDTTTESIDFWRDEYHLDHTIATFDKPVVALMDGIVLGGGVGISAHASHRVVTERTSLGMPETRIGFVPDVGGPWLLAHAPGELGTHLALTAASADGPDTIALGLADVLVPSVRLAELESALRTEAPDAVLARLSIDPGASALAAQRSWIDECYRGDDPLAIVARLRACGVEAAALAADEIEARSPTAVALTLAALRRAATLPDLRAALDQDLAVSAFLLGVPDMAEGIRAQVIDKDRSPTWDPATLAEVDPSTFGHLFG